MRKYISVSVVDRNVNIRVLDGADGLYGVMAGGYIESSDLSDLETPARIMSQQLTGQVDEDLVEKLVEAFEQILTPPYTVSIRGQGW